MFDAREFAIVVQRWTPHDVHKAMLDRLLHLLERDPALLFEDYVDPDLEDDAWFEAGRAFLLEGVDALCALNLRDEAARSWLRARQNYSAERTAEWFTEGYAWEASKQHFIDMFAQGLLYDWFEFLAVRAYCGVKQ